MENPRMLIIGLDGLVPELAFDRYIGVMPNLKNLMESATWGELESTHPPITVPAWMAMATGQDPGTLGVYGFRHRRTHTYTDLWTANAASFDTKAVWDYLGLHGLRTCLVGLPPSYPPTPLPGWRVGCFLTPDKNRIFTYPPELGNEVLEVAPNYRFDVTFRTDDRDSLLRELYTMTQDRFRVISHLMTTLPWDLFWFHEIGTDRIHHAFWKFTDPQHPKYQHGNPYENVIRDYYQFIDAQLGELLSHVDDQTTILVVSDHGAMATHGVFALNDWLVQEGYLTLNARPSPGTPLERSNVDWCHTVAWAMGGYYARVYLNVEGREPAGIIPPEHYESTLSEIASAIQHIQGPHGEPMNTRVFRPQDIYRDHRGDPPDLMVYFDNLAWRAGGTLGWDNVFLPDNDTGPDDAVHSQYGCFVLRRPGHTKSERRYGLSIYDVAPTIMDIFGLEIPREMEGTACR